MAIRWTEEKRKQLVKMKLSGLNWSEIATHFNTTTAAVDRKFHYLQQEGAAPYKEEHEYASKSDEILSYYQQHGHRKTLKKYGSYVIHYLRRNGLWKRSLAPVKKDVEQFLNSDDRYYWAGFIAADGCIKSPTHLNITLAKKDADHLSKMHSLAGGSLHIYASRVEWNIHEASEAVQFLKTLNIVPRKTKILKPPCLSDESQIRDFIRGYFDGDGSVTMSVLKSGSMIKNVIFLGTKKMLKWISASLSRYAKCHLSPKIQCSRGTYVINYGSTHDFLNISRWMYEGMQVCLARKHDRFQDIKELLKPRRSYRLYNEMNGD